MGAYADKMAAIEEAERMAAEQMAGNGIRYGGSGTEIPYAWQAAHEFYGENRGPKVPNIWEVPFIFQPTDPKLRATPIVQPPNQLTQQPFNPYDVGIASYLRNIWGVALEKAKQENTTPKIYTYEQPLPEGSGASSGANSGYGGVVGWFQGIPEYFNNLRAQDQKEWEEYKRALDERKNANTNQEGQEVNPYIDANTPLKLFLEDPGRAAERPSSDVSIPEKTGNTWDDFVSGVKAGWEAGGMTDYKTPLLIAGGVLVLILIIK